MSILSKKWSLGLKKSRKNIVDRITSVFSGNKEINEAFWDGLEEILIESDMGVETSMVILEDLKEKYNSSKEINEQDIIPLMKKQLDNLLEPIERNDSLVYRERPQVILVVGVNGTGKTTTIGKLAYRFKNQGKKVLLAGADTFRAAAGEQLEIWSQRSGADLVTQPMGADPASVAFDALDAAIARDVDILIVDTAGRLHNKVGLMEELKKIHRVLGKRLENAPHEILLVMDATTGQNGLMQAKIFTEAVGVNGIVLTKLDGTAKGGIIIAIQNTMGVPVKWVGLGEGIDDLIPFDAKEFIKGILGEE